ncbi:MAG: adenylate/guanylate cyclase domain-containing protein [Nannocystis sp.]|nr:adenylate/guanylate cyclase domain-containing protein [Nannocystis sp.]
MALAAAARRRIPGDRRGVAERGDDRGAGRPVEPADQAGDPQRAASGHRRGDGGARPAAQGVPRVDDRVRRRGPVLAPGRPRRPGELHPAAGLLLLAVRPDHGAFGVQKVTTIGDTYLAVAGVPQRRAAHAVDATLAALRLAQAVATRPGPVVDEWEWSFRIGLHSGPCISGVTGARRHVFDLWGDTVSVAAHVQRVGRADVVSVSGATAELIDAFFELSFDAMTVVRNAGEVAVFVVRGIRPELVDAETGLVNAAFRERYLAMFGDECPAAAGDVLLGAL